MEQTLAWIVLPALAVTTALGVGLLVERVAGARAPRGLALPLGFAASVALLAFPYSVGLGARWAALLLAAGTVAGLVLERGRIRAALPDTPGAFAALGVYVVYIAPIALSGDATFAGYTFLGDTSVHFALIDYITVHGTDVVDLPASNYQAVTHTQLQNGYPLGLHFELATLRQVLGIGVDEAYQPFIAVSIALAALPAARVLEAVGMSRLPACAGGALAVTAYLPYSYALQGGIKEMGMICFILLGAALALEVARGRNPVRDACLFGIAAAAGFQVYSVGGLPWFGLIGAAVLAGVALADPGRRRGIALAAGGAAGAFVVAALPGLPAAFDFYGEGSRLLTSSEGADVGNLVGALPGWEAFGIWLRHDYRLATTRPEVTYALIGGAILLAGLGATWSVRNRRPGVLLLAVAAVAVWVVLPAGLYIEGKLLAIMSPALVLMAVTGAWALTRTGYGLEGAALALVLTGAVLVSDAMAYRGVYLAPKPRVDELAAIGERFAGQGPAMLPEFEEYGKHYLRELDPVVPTDGWTTQSPALRRAGPAYAVSLDLDQLGLEFVQQFPLLVVRRAPVTSRPPGSYELAMRGDFYEVWRRTGPDVATDHVPAGDRVDPTGTVACGEARRLGAQARALDQGLLVARRDPPPSLAVRRMAYPPAWQLAPDGRVVPQGQGRATGSLRAPAGTYRVWVRGAFGRGVDVIVDGRRVGHAEDVQTPDQSALVGSVSLGSGSHEIELFRPGGDLAPGNRRDEGYDRVFLEPVQAPRLERLAPADAQRACAGPVDWIEIVQPAPLPAGRGACPRLDARPVAERVLLRPAPGTFYSVDALNPDVVERDGRLHMFFSGNRAPTEEGLWRTGLATSASPLAGFAVDPAVSEPFLNGGTIVRGNRFLQGYDRRGERVPRFATSADGRRWRTFTELPAGGPGEWNRYPSDISLEKLPGGFRAYFAGRPGRTGADLGSAAYRAGRWSAPERVLVRAPGFWDALDLGEPATFRAFGRRYMLYGGLRSSGRPRQIGLAVWVGGRWRRCGTGPLIAAGHEWYSHNAIDPEPHVRGGTLLVYFGGGDRAGLGGNLGGTIGVRAYRLADLRPGG